MTMFPVASSLSNCHMSLQFGKRTLNTQPTRLSVAAVNTI